MKRFSRARKWVFRIGGAFLGAAVGLGLVNISLGGANGIEALGATGVAPGVVSAGAGMLGASSMMALTEVLRMRFDEYPRLEMLAQSVGVKGDRLVAFGENRETKDLAEFAHSADINQVRSDYDAWEKKERVFRAGRDEGLREGRSRSRSHAAEHAEQEHRAERQAHQATQARQATQSRKPRGLPASTGMGGAL